MLFWRRNFPLDVKLRTYITPKDMDMKALEYLKLAAMLRRETNTFRRLRETRFYTGLGSETFFFLKFKNRKNVIPLGGNR